MAVPGNAKKMSRVDVQVCVIVAVVVALSFLCVYLFNYSVTYRDMIDTLKERSDSIYTYLEESIDMATFSTIESAEDMDEESYRTMKESFEAVKEATGVRYLYTAKKAADGTFVYVVDGLPSDSADFRAPGDPIEPEIVNDMERALAGETVYPNDIKDTGWGYVFVAYYPIHNGSEVVGVVGIEFDAQRQFEAFRIVRIGTPAIAAVFCLIAIAVARFAFRRVSNPWYRDMANTDYLTGLKNRNAFEVDVANWERAGTGCAAIVCADLDGLKQTNDTLGHAVGDELIRQAAEGIAEAAGKDAAVYRTGGDEFVACLFECDGERAACMAKAMREACERRTVEGRPVSLSVGWAVRCPGEDVEAMTRRADELMYKEKKRAHGTR